MRAVLITVIFMVAFLLSSCQSLGWESDMATPVFPPPYQTGDLEESSVDTTQTPRAELPQTPSAERATLTPEPSLAVNTSTLTLTPLPSPTSRPKFAEDIDQIISKSGGRWHVIIKEIDGPILYSQLPEQRINIASVAKVPIALLFFKALEAKGIKDNQLRDHLLTTGTGGRTFDQLLRAMLVNSEEKATDILMEYIPGYINIPAQMAEWEMQSLDLVSRRYTAAGMATIFERLYQGDYISSTARELMLSYLSEYTPNDEIRIGILMEDLPDNYHIYNKRGSLLTPYVIADCAILENEGGTDYVLIIFASQGEPETTYEVLDQALGEVVLAFWENLAQENP